jgi:DnaK suppressor protein
MNSESTLRSRRGCSPFGEPQLDAFRDLLLSRQEEVARSLAGLTKAGLRPPGDGSSVPVHTADLATETFDQEMSLDGMARTQVELSQIHDALERIEHRSYGLCNDCGQAISVARLEALLTAEFCIDCKSRLEAT